MKQDALFEPSPKTGQPFCWITFAFAVGIVAGQARWVSFQTACCFVVAFLAGSLFLGRKQRMASLFLLGALIFLGVLYAKSYQSLPKEHLNHVARYYRKQSVSVEGRIVSDVANRQFFNGTRTTFVLDVRRLKTRWGWKTKRGRVLVNLFRDENLVYGDEIHAEGKLHPPFEFASEGKFSYRDFLRRRGIYLVLSVKKAGRVDVKARRKGAGLKAASIKIKHRLKAVLARYLSPNEAGIMQAVLLGDRHNIPQHIRELFAVSGVAHVLAISGLHLGIVAFLIFLFVKILPLPRRAQDLLTIIFLVFYAFLTGARPSVVRATVMAVVFLASVMLEREGNSLNTLSFAALLILLWNPLNLFDAGFQLSFTSVFFILFFYPLLMEVASGFLKKNPSRIARYCIRSLGVSLAVYLGVGGFIAYYFHTISPIAVLANLVVVPLTGLIVALGMGLMFSGVLGPIAAPFFAVCLKVVLNFMVATIFLLAQIPGAYVRLTTVPLWGVILYYALLCLGVWGKVSLSGFSKKEKVKNPKGLENS